MEFLSSATEWLVRGPVFLLAFGFVLSTVVVFHEFGHFIVARLCGVRVEVFSLGFGKAIAKFTDPWGVEWRLSMIPLGGYVKFFGDANAASMPPTTEEDEGERRDAEDDHEGGAAMGTHFPAANTADGLTPEERKVAFHHKPVWARGLIVAAGPIANFVLAMIIFTTLFVSFGQVQSRTMIVSVLEDTPAAEAGLEPGDLVLKANGKDITSSRDLLLAIRLSSGDPVTLTVRRGEETIEIVATPVRETVEDSLGNRVKGGRLGFQYQPVEVERVKLGVFQSVGAAGAEIGRVVSSTYRYIARLVRGKEDASQLGGPVRILKYSGQVAEQSYEAGGGGGDGLRTAIINLINLAGFLSVSVGLLNLLPVPVLDGGHLLFYLFEAAGAPLGPKVQAFGFRAGMALLLVFFLFVTFNDVTDLFAGAVAR